MKVFKKIMNAVAAVENCILVVSTLLILVLTVGNVFSRKVIHRSWSFTEELVVAVFVLITLMAAALACREGELVNLSLVTDHCSVHYFYRNLILVRYGKSNHTAGKRKTYLRSELAGVDLLVLRANRIRMYDLTFY